MPAQYLAEARFQRPNARIGRNKNAPQKTPKRKLHRRDNLKLFQSGLPPKARTSAHKCAQTRLQSRIPAAPRFRISIRQLGVGNLRIVQKARGEKNEYDPLQNGQRATCTCERFANREECSFAKECYPPRAMRFLIIPKGHPLQDRILRGGAVYMMGEEKFFNLWR